MGEKNREFGILAGKIKENMVMTDYLPYTGYLDSFDYVIHHGGAGITYNCIKYKKPSLVVPQDYDQFDFAARIEYFETGIKAENINDTEDITQKLNILFNKEKWGELYADLKLPERARALFQVAFTLRCDRVNVEAT